MSILKHRSTEGKKWQKWYKTAQWKRLRLTQLSKQPMCECPHCQGRDLKANVVDHHIPHKGDRRLFYDAKNLRSMAKPCHDKFKQSLERGGHGFNGCDEQGNPLVPQAHWT